MGVINRVIGARNRAPNIDTIVGFRPMSDLISAPEPGKIRVHISGISPETFLSEFNLQKVELHEAAVALFFISATKGALSEQIEEWVLARELYVPSIVLITDLAKSEVDFDDMAAIISKQLDPVVTPLLVLHDDLGLPAALIDLDSLKIHTYEKGELKVHESDPEHKVLVFEFRKEYLEALEAAGDDAFNQGLLFPALPFSYADGMGRFELAGYLNSLPGSS